MTFQLINLETFDRIIGKAKIRLFMHRYYTIKCICSLIKIYSLYLLTPSTKHTKQMYDNILKSTGQKGGYKHRSKLTYAFLKHSVTTRFFNELHVNKQLSIIECQRISTFVCRTLGTVQLYSKIKNLKSVITLRVGNKNNIVR